MAFNFNWSPLTADADFYARARDLLTKALNKSPKPPIIVDDILVSEFNLGTVPPDLEILEIGDLAEDRFRGIFKMTYSGDAFLTLKTRVQANPLNTYLYSKPTFTSPQPLAAASGLTIPLSITLSDFKLSAFIILVFSKQKGLTLVFRNDPLESLKVSSTFDSIQFVRDYLQRTIEQQLRNLMMDELPAIIHRLSLQLWCPDQANKGTETPTETEDEAGVDPLASPPLDPVDANGNLLDPNAISELTLNGGGEVQSLFSQKNLLRLAALTDSHRTLSLFTPGIRDVVFRAWTGYGDRSETSTPLASTPSLTKTMSFHAGNSTTYTFSDTASNAHGSLPSRPSLVSMNSGTNGRALGAGRSRAGRKKKTRVVNLRRTKSEAATPEEGSEVSDTASLDNPLSDPIVEESIPEETESSIIAEAATPSKVRFRNGEEAGCPPVMANLQNAQQVGSPLKQALQSPERQEYTSIAAATSGFKTEKGKPPGMENQSVSSENSSVILEQAWIMKMAGEIAKRVYDEKNRQRSPWDEEREDAPPPAYEAATR
ncbi:ERMES complex subunit [Fusarium irregulare]|uniref:Mitochondrial distribution and morphology protein 34 n=1 Tax=Fusarium irregulare TaxID=2494466 RepID=A0A9W8PL75_9HYPO|nr:ERMES complex subunit [Fusarium irregulare]KAJ4020010.1 ERMES complex subunit [Fusarium irregulare]